MTLQMFTEVYMVAQKMGYRPLQVKNMPNISQRSAATHLLFKV